MLITFIEEMNRQNDTTSAVSSIIVVIFKGGIDLELLDFRIQILLSEFDLEMWEEMFITISPH